MSSFAKHLDDSDDGSSVFFFCRMFNENKLHSRIRHPLDISSLPSDETVFVHVILNITSIWQQYGYMC